MSRGEPRGESIASDVRAALTRTRRRRRSLAAEAVAGLSADRSEQLVERELGGVAVGTVLVSCMSGAAAVVGDEAVSGGLFA